MTDRLPGGVYAGLVTRGPRYIAELRGGPRDGERLERFTGQPPPGFLVYPTGHDPEYVTLDPRPAAALGSGGDTYVLSTPGTGLVVHYDYLAPSSYFFS
jgi:hypothetical protein